ncbi:MAG: hypothetical protein RBQ71_00905 [Acholeplasmataceae bacterium]|jgi:hypothetical protein|nr:hypothetical protein [Acholeplasmataceae bacterium]
MEERQFIDEPLEQYDKVFRELHEKNTTEYIDQLIETSHVNPEENRTTVKAIRKKEDELRLTNKKISKYQGLKTLLIILAIASLFGSGYLVYQIIQLGFQMLFAGLAALGVILMVLFVMLIKKKINPVIKDAQKVKDEIQLKIKELMDQAWEQMRPLNELFTEGISKELFQKTIPLIKLDKMFDAKRLDYLVNRFGLYDENDMNRSALFVQSGEINGNPFYLCRDLIHYLGTKRYSGSITIHWTTTSVVNGKRVTNHHTQVLTATVEKPCPYYYKEPYLVYGNDAAPDLIFSREDSDAEHMNEKQIERKVKRDLRKLEKKTEKSISKGGSYTVMGGNSEFEVLFGASNRNNEVQFRLLFTPLAQKQLLELMKDQTIGYGDDFDFEKIKKINVVYPEHLDNFDLNVDPSYYHGYELDAIKEKFIAYNMDYFKRVYFTFAPILAIPLYQHTLPHEYIYKDLYESYASFYEHEKVVNHMNAFEFKHPLCTTESILKTKTIKSDNYEDIVKVTSYGYRTEQRVDYIQKMGGDGRMHTIPVEWTEYLPVEQESKVSIHVVEEEKEESFNESFRKMFENLKNKDVSKENLYAIHRFIAHVIKD